MSYQLRTFEIEITSAYHHFGLLASAQSNGIETPIYLRGIQLSQGNSKWVICTIELCIISGFFYDDFLQVLSRSTGCSRDTTTLHVSHQHDVPFFDELYHGTLRKYGKCNYDHKNWLNFLAEIENKIKLAIQIAPQQITHVSMDKAAIIEYASDRRIFQNNKINWRSTKCQNPELKAMPIGIIDPNLYQCVLWGSENKPLATLNFYASHPQVADGRGLLSSDAPGVALKKMRGLLPHTAHLYFDGCGGDIGNGKFAGPSKDADLEIFGDKLFQGMKAAFEKAQPEPLRRIEWRNHTFNLPIKKPMDDLNALLEQIHSADFSLNPKKLVVARKIGLIEKNIPSYPFRISKILLNQNHLIFFPGEMFLTYQTYTLSKTQEKTCIAAYGDGFIGYVPEDDDFALGGYEIDGSFQILMPGCEKLIKSEIDKIL